MKKLIFLIDSLGVGGAEKVLLEYIKNISGKGLFNISVIINRSSDNSFIHEKVSRYVDEVVSLDGIFKTNIKFVDKLIARVFLSKKIQHSNVIIDFLDGDFYKSLRHVDVRKITWLHSSLSGLVVRKKNVLQRLNYYDDVIMICHDMKEELEGFDVKWKDRVSVIYNPFDFESIDIMSNDYSDISDAERGILESDFILTVCRLNESEKDVSSLLLAYSEALSKGMHKALVIIGDGKDRTLLETMSEELGISNHVHFLGVKSNPYVWMKHASTFVLSSKGEGFGLVLVEALFLTKSVIASDCPVGPSEILHRGDIGGLFSVGDITRLSHLLLSPPKKIEIDLSKYSVDNSMLELMKIL